MTTTVEAFLGSGARVVINGRTTESTAEAIAELGGGERLVPAPGDVATAQGCEAIVKNAINELGGLDILVIAQEWPSWDRSKTSMR